MRAQPLPRSLARPTLRSLAGLTAAVVLGPLLALVPAEAGTRVMPGSFTGYAFDTCDAPSQRAMDAWHGSSKFWAVGVYIAGSNRACKAQPNLTRRWVARQSANGWRLLPLVVGRQASCSPKGYYRGKRISANPARAYAQARQQGRVAAANGVQAARALRIARRSVLWYDLEHFDLTQRHCRRSALAFTRAWTHALHRLGYRSGFYSSASSGITMIDQARRRAPRDRGLPDLLWVAEWNGTDSLRSSYIPRAGWWPHRRVHQYRGPHDERHGGVRINIDSNFLSTGGGTRAGRLGAHCGVRLGFRSYPRLHHGVRGARVRAAQCLLRQQRYYRGGLHGRYNKATVRAVRQFRREREGLAPRGVLTRRTWTALLATGSTPLVKFGSGGEEVRRLQRALNAASSAGLRVDGVFGRRELSEVRHYQREAGLPRSGVVTSKTWGLLKHGVMARPMPHPRPRWRPLLEHLLMLEPVPHNSGAGPG